MSRALDRAARALRRVHDTRDGPEFHEGQQVRLRANNRQGKVAKVSYNYDHRDYEYLIEFSDGLKAWHPEHKLVWLPRS